MKKVAVAVLTLALLTMIFAAAPVMAAPKGEQKVPVTIQWTAVQTTTLERNDSDGLQHRIMETTWTVKLFVDGSSTPIDGTGICTRRVLYAYSKLQMAVYDEHYELSFPSKGGGFEGNAHILLYNWDSATRTYEVVIHGLFHGTDAFEGQTLNVGRDRGPSSFVWEGYLLKP